MKSEDFNGLFIGDQVTRRYDQAKFEVVDVKPIEKTNGGAEQEITLKMVSDVVITSCDPLWWEKEVSHDAA